MLPLVRLLLPLLPGQIFAIGELDGGRLLLFEHFGLRNDGRLKDVSSVISISNIGA